MSDDTTRSHSALHGHIETFDDAPPHLRIGGRFKVLVPMVGMSDDDQRRMRHLDGQFVEVTGSVWRDRDGYEPQKVKPSAIEPKDEPGDISEMFKRLAELTPDWHCPECGGYVLRGTNRHESPHFHEGRCVECERVFALAECPTGEGGES